MKAPLDWKIFERVPNAEAIAAGLKDIPAHWSLTPLQDKSPRRDKWQTEPFIPHSSIAELILHGERKVSKKGKQYQAYWSGFGLRTGEASGGLLAIDVDGESTQPLLDVISGGDIPLTPSWSSGKPGRYQLLFQIPDNIREQLKEFNRTILTEWGNLQTARDENGKPTELLEFRYNRSQSCLPPSRHPTTGAYHWINNPADVPVAIAPDWLCQLLLKLASAEKQQQEAKSEKQRQIEERKQQRLATGLESSTSLEDVIEQTTRRLSPEEAFNWTGHNWKHQGQREWVGYCPRHQSKSGTAFHVKPDTLEWFCHGCNEGGRLVQYRWFVRGGNGTPKSKDFVEVCKEIANDAGISMPEFTPQEYTTSRQKLDRPITRDEWELKFGVGRWLGQTITSILGKAKGFGKKQITRRKTSAPPFIIRYPQDPLPSQKDYEGRDLPRIIFKKRKRLEVLAKLKQLGWKFVCDRSFTGSGKSYEAGLLHPDENTAHKIWYFDLNHTNPSTETIETMSNMPPRHNGMVMVPGKVTPLGYPQIRWDSGEFGEDVPRIPSLCHNADWFIGLKSKGWDVDSQQDSIQSEDGESVSRNPICKQCRYAFKCHQEKGEGYGYLAVRREIMVSRRIRASLDSAPSPKRRKYSPEEGEKKYDYSNDIAFVEEASRYLRGTTTLTARANEIAQLCGYAERNAPEAHAALQPFRFALQDALNGDFDCIEKGKNRGADHETLINEFPRPDAIAKRSSASQIANLPTLIQQVKGAMPSIDEVVVEADSVVGLGGAYRKIGQFARDMMKSQAAYETKKNIEALPPNVLVDALEIWAGIKPGSLRVQGKQLQVTIQNTRHADILTACGFVVLLDATPNIPYLEQILGERILQIEEERPPMTNLTVVNVNMKGLGSNQISESAKNRELALLDCIEQQHQEVKRLTNKGDLHLTPDGHWFHDNRGSNAFKGVDVLVAFGTPRTNLGAAQDEYRALFGSLEGFEDYYRGLVEAEIVQAVGRQRAHQYPDREFYIYMVSTNQDLSYLTDLGYQVENKEAFELTPLAGTPDQVTLWKLTQAWGQLQDQGEKITQEALAALIGKSQEFISKFAKPLGGWSALKKLLLVLLGIYRGSNNFSPLAELNEEARFLAESYLPMMLDAPTEAPQSLADIVRAYGLSTVLKGVKALAPHMQARMLGMLLQQDAHATPQENPSPKLLPSLYSPNRTSNKFEPTPTVTISVDSEPTEVPPEEPAPAPVPIKTKPLIITPQRVKQVAAATAAGIAAAVISTHPAAADPQNCGSQAAVPQAEISQSAEIAQPENSLTPLEILIDRLAAVKNQQEFWQIVEGHDSSRIEDALLYQEPHHRAQLRRWYEAATRRKSLLGTTGSSGAESGDTRGVLHSSSP